MPVHLFIPCFVDQGAPAVAEAVVELLGRLGVAWEYPAAQTCCGQFALSMGDLATARRLARHFLKVFAPAEAILCPSATCTRMVRHHYPLLAQDARERQELAAVASRVWELSEWLAARGPLPWTPEWRQPLVLHQSCQARQLGVLPAAAQVLSQVAGLKLTQVSPYYACCGFGGVFKFKHPELSRALGEAYLAAVHVTGAAGLVSLDFGCLMHLAGLARGRGWDLQFRHLAEVLTRPLAD